MVMMVLPDSSAKDLRVLDLTKPISHSKESMGVPGLEFAAVGGLGATSPRRYQLPLEVRIQAVKPASLGPGSKVIVEAILRNRSGSPFYLPASRNSLESHRPGTKGRRTFNFAIRFVAEEREAITSLMVATVGSQTLPESLVKLNPEEAILLLLQTDSLSISQWLSAGVRDVNIRLVCSEWTLEDGRYFVKELSEEVQSQNTAQLTIQP